MTFAEYRTTFAGILNSMELREVDALADAIEHAYRRAKQVFIIGNGGSAANASHLCEDLGKGTLSDFENQPRLKVISLADSVPYITAWGNDEGYDRVFLEQLRNLAQSGDLLIAVSGSGNSPNVLRAVEWANDNGLLTFGVTGFDGGRLRKIASKNLLVPNDDMGAVEAAHAVVFHYLVTALKPRFASSQREGAET